MCARRPESRPPASHVGVGLIDRPRSRPLSGMLGVVMEDEMDATAHQGQPRALFRPVILVRLAAVDTP